MELQTTRELRRNERFDRTAAKKADAPAQAPYPPPPPPPTAPLSRARQAVSFLEEQNRRMWEHQREQEERRYARMEQKIAGMDATKQKLDRMEDELDIMNKCNKIAASIMKGNRVPTKDLIYLMEHDQAGYKLAMAMRRHNPDPKDEESVLDEEDLKGKTPEASVGGEAPAPSAEAPDTGGADTTE